MPFFGTERLSRPLTLILPPNILSCEVVNPEVKHLGILQLSDGNSLAQSPRASYLRLSLHNPRSCLLPLSRATSRRGDILEHEPPRQRSRQLQTAPDSSRLEAGQQIATCNKQSVPTRSSAAQADARPRWYLQLGVCARAGGYLREVDAVKHEQTQRFPYFLCRI